MPTCQDTRLSAFDKAGIKGPDGIGVKGYLYRTWIVLTRMGYVSYQGAMLTLPRYVLILINSRHQSSRLPTQRARNET